MPSQVSRDRFEFGEHVVGRPRPTAIGCSVQAVIDVVANQRPLCLADSLLDCMKLLRQIKARAAVGEHLDHLVKVTFSAFQTLDDSNVSFVNVIIWHQNIISPRGGYGNGGVVAPRGADRPISVP